VLVLVLVMPMTDTQETGTRSWYQFLAPKTNVGHFAYKTFRLLDTSPTTWTLRLIDISPTGQFAYETVRHAEDADKNFDNIIAAKRTV